jgi:transcriptional regulator with GAF, ATPase, and Fis domain
MTSEEERGTGGYDHLLAGISARFVRLPAEAVDRETRQALGEIGRQQGVDRVILTEYVQGGNDLQVMHSWANRGIEAIPQGWLASQHIPQILARLRRGDVCRLSHIDAPKPGWETDHEEFTRSGARAHLAVPITVGGNPLGGLHMVSLDSDHAWTNTHVDRLRLLGEVFGNALDRRDRERQLEAALREVKRLQRQLQAENRYLREEIRADFDGIVGASPAIERVLAVAEQVARTDVTVLILGETGTGKELVARAIHEQSRRSDRPMIKVSCPALPPSLAESELFGHERGAFTGAVSRRRGRFELAHGGTIFLDEVGDLAPEIQAKLLRVLQEGEFERLGSSETRSVDVRILAATGRDLVQDVEEGLFRADLYYRLRVVPIEMPPLRERPEDIPALVWHFVERARGRHGKVIREVPQGIMARLVAYEWPGNVRELQNVIERCVVLSPGATLELVESLHGGPRSDGRRLAAGVEDLASVERSHIEAVLERCAWKVKGAGNAAERLGLNPSTLRGRMHKLGITRPSSTGPS